MRTIKFQRHEFHEEKPEDREAPLFVIVYDVPYFGACGIFPPFHITNQFFASGGSRVGMSPGATWEPFTITEAEYFELVSVMRTWLLKPWVMQRDTNGASLNSIVPSII
jgi:hypothetical protein